jgi:peptidoglycan/LPS O-acetylase OafA/YrhL
MTSATLDRAHRKTEKALTKSTIRHDLQGLRALAVIAVILDHLVGWPLGGFVGVDVFFVLSGFLITGLLLREHDRTGTISFSGFYRRRVKRILPAASLVLIATVAASFLVFNVPRAMQTLGDGIAGFFFAANWRIAAVGTDYFQAGGPVSPLQHYWSLAVEEQFYFVWPLLMFVIFLLGSRWASSVKQIHRVVALAIILLSIASFLWSLYETASAPTWAYFSTFSRAWELGVGAIAAVFISSFAKIPAAIRPVLGWVGLLGIIVSLFITRPDAAFPAPGAALPVLATVLVIIAGTGGQQRYLWPLMNPVTSYIGDISFSLYLWHFPIIILGTTLWGDDALTLLILSVAVLLSAAYSYHLVEDPIRKSAWLSAERPKKSRRHRNRRTPVTRRYQLTALSLVFLVVAGLTTAVLLPREQEDLASAGALPMATALPDTEEQPTELAALQDEMTVALQQTTWPELEPSMDAAITGPQAPADVMSCGNGTVDESECTWGDPAAPRTMITIGNSLSMTYVAALRAAIGDSSDWKLISYGMFGCPFGTEASVANLSTIPDGCESRASEAVEAINRINPDVVFVSGTFKDAATEFAKIDAPSKIVFVQGPPVDKAISECYTPSSSPSDCVGSVRQGWGADEKKLAASVENGVYVDSVPWFCIDGSCPSFVGGIPMKKDLNHMTPAYAERLGPVIRETLSGAGVL